MLASCKHRVNCRTGARTRSDASELYVTGSAARLGTRPEATDRHTGERAAVSECNDLAQPLPPHGVDFAPQIQARVNRVSELVDGQWADKADAPPTDSEI
jgi:hypothetical protein